MSEILVCMAVLGALGLLSAGLLYVVARRFHVEEDPRIALIEELLPGANCGGCGRSGCHDFAVACSQASSLSSLSCPGAGEEAMKRIAAIVGLDAVGAVRRVAVLKCAGVKSCRPKIAFYDGPRSCAAVAAIGSGDTLCSYGCLGCGDCVEACAFGAITMDAETALAVIDDKKCIGCAACESACPRGVIFTRPRGPRGMKVWVACSNPEKGAVAVKECKAACIGCGKCVRACPHGAIALDGFVARIDPLKCKLCRKCVDVCPTDAIHKSNFPEATANQI